MHMKWKKVAVFGCVAMMTMYTVAGCGNDAGTADAAQGVAVAETTETAEAESGRVSSGSRRSRAIRSREKSER